MENQPEKDNDAQKSWEEIKRLEQNSFGLEAGESVTIDRIRTQVLLNAKFWENEILHEHLGDLTRDDREKQPDIGLEPER